MSTTAGHIAMVEAMSRDARHLDMIEQASRALHEVTSPGEPLPAREATGHEARCPHRVVRPSGMVMVNHACNVKIWLQTAAFSSEFEVHDHDGLEHVLGLLTAYAHAWSYNPSMYILPSVRPLPEDAYSNQLRLDYDAETDVGAIACTIDNSEETGMWFTRGDATPPERPLIWDYHNGDETRFPSDAAVPGEQWRTAIHEFFDLNGMALPASVEWQRSPEVRW